MNRVCYVLDASGSMCNNVAKTCDLTKASIAKLNSNDLVTLITFEENNVRTVFQNVLAQDVKFETSDYLIGGSTNLCDAVHDGCNLLINQTQAITTNKKKKKKPHDTYVVIVLTDGGENSSRRVSQAQLSTELKNFQKTDLWTFAWLVPPGDVGAVKRLGIDESNIFAWEDIKVAAQALSSGMDNLKLSRGRGETSLKKGFFANLDGVKKADVRAEMTDISSKVKRASVKSKETIKQFCEREFGEFKKGNAMYELTESETVQDYKEVALIDKRRPHEVFLGGRKILGLPDGKVRLKPGNLGHYRAFVGSTSTNRNTDPNTEILYGDGIGKVVL